MYEFDFNLRKRNVNHPDQHLFRSSSFRVFLCKISPFLFLFLLLLGCGGEAEEASTAPGWMDDITWISDSLPLVHYNLYMYQQEDSLTVRLETMEAELENLTDMGKVMQLTRILASMKCSHTGIAFWDYCDMTVYPLSVMWLEEGLFVTAIDSSFEELIGSRLLEYDGKPSEEAAAAMAEMFPATNDIAPRVRAERFMMLAPCMEALGYGSTSEPVDFVFLTEQGDTVELQMTAMGFDYSRLVDFHSLEMSIMPIWLESDDCYWFKYLPDRSMLYCAYNSCNLMDDYHMENFVQDMKDVVVSEDVRSIAVDLRRNQGGNSLLATPLIEWFGEVSATGDIQLNLIVGRWTYSSGVLNALEISGIPGVTVYGEMTGGAPNHLGEVKLAQLPYSSLTVSYPTKYFQMVQGEGTTIVPDVEIPLSPDMLFHGENLILDAVQSNQQE